MGFWQNLTNRIRTTWQRLRGIKTEEKLPETPEPPQEEPEDEYAEQRKQEEEEQIIIEKAKEIEEKKKKSIQETKEKILIAKETKRREQEKKITEEERKNILELQRLREEERKEQIEKGKFYGDKENVKEKLENIKTGITRKATLTDLNTKNDEKDHLMNTVLQNMEEPNVKQAREIVENYDKLKENFTGDIYIHFKNGETVNISVRGESAFDVAEYINNAITIGETVNGSEFWRNTEADLQNEGHNITISNTTGTTNKGNTVTKIEQYSDFAK